MFGLLVSSDLDNIGTITTGKMPLRDVLYSTQQCL